MHSVYLIRGWIILKVSPWCHQPRMQEASVSLLCRIYAHLHSAEAACYHLAAGKKDHPWNAILRLPAGCRQPKYFADELSAPKRVKHRNRLFYADQSKFHVFHLSLQDFCVGLNSHNKQRRWIHHRFFFFSEFPSRISLSASVWFVFWYHNWAGRFFIGPVLQDADMQQSVSRELLVTGRTRPVRAPDFSPVVQCGSLQLEWLLIWVLQLK